MRFVKMKTDAEKLEIMTAFYVNNAPLELFNLNKENAQWEICYNPSWSWDKYDYRIKQEETMPYETFDDFIEAWKQHRFVQNKETKAYTSIISANPITQIIMGDTTKCSLYDLYHDFIWEDGTICGKENT